METARQHPYASAAVGAAAGLLLAEGARRAVSSWASSQGSPGNDVNDDKDDDTRRGSQASAEDQSEDSGEEGEGDRDKGGDEYSSSATEAFQTARQRAGDATRRTISSIRDGASSLGHQAQSAFRKGRDSGAEFTDDHPLLIAAAALTAGIALGLLLPETETENRLLGKWSDKTAGRAKKTGKELLSQSKEMIGRAVRKGTDAIAREAEREGLTPTRLGRKIKRVTAHVRDAVSDAVQD